MPTRTGLTGQTDQTRLKESKVPTTVRFLIFKSDKNMVECDLFHRISQEPLGVRRLF